MHVPAKTIAFWTCAILLAVVAFLVSVWLVDTMLSYTLPRIFAEAPRRDIHEMPSLNTWVIVGKHGVTLAVSVWAGISTGQYLLGIHQREGRPGAKSESKDTEGRPFPSSWQQRHWQNGKGAEDRREDGGAEAGNLFNSETASCTPPLRPSTPISDTTIQDWTIYHEHFGEPAPLTLSTINNQSDGLSLSSADDTSGSNTELHQRLKEIPKQLHPPDQLTPFTLSEASHHKAWLVQQLASFPQLAYNESQLNKCIILDLSRQYIPTSKNIEDEYQVLRYQILARKPTTNMRTCRIFAFREMVLFNRVKCWVWFNLHMLGEMPMDETASSS